MLGSLDLDELLGRSLVFCDDYCLNYSNRKIIIVLTLETLLAINPFDTNGDYIPQRIHDSN